MLLHVVEVRDPRLVHQGVAAAFILEGAHHPFVYPPTMTVPQARPPVRRLERQLGPRLRLVGRVVDLGKQAAGPLPGGLLRQRVHPAHVLGAGGRRSRKPDRERRAQDPGRRGEAGAPTTLPRAPVTRRAQPQHSEHLASTATPSGAQPPSSPAFDRSRLAGGRRSNGPPEIYQHLRPDETVIVTGRIRRRAARRPRAPLPHGHRGRAGLYRGRGLVADPRGEPVCGPGGFLAQPKPAARQGLRGLHRHRAGVALHRFRATPRRSPFPAARGAPWRCRRPTPPDVGHDWSRHASFSAWSDADGSPP